MAAPISNIKGTFKDSKGNPRAGAIVMFQPLDTPFTSGGDIIVSDVLMVVLDSAGQFGMDTQNNPYQVVRGTYRVVVSDKDAFNIFVPGDGGTYDIKDIGVNVGSDQILQAVVSATDLGSLVIDTYNIKKTLKTDPYAVRLRMTFLGEGTILPTDKLAHLFSSMVGYQ